ncbi:odorant receptor 4-like [Cydia pomonella]|uniref:odorant receptor 4-like n=1 Tax=Cydia pomonella TaxID=82600 RepID=UPI002ADE94AA|nr:odorant receptor 4-like [Cydia pomonella]
MSFESVAFEESLQKTNRIIRIIGLQTDDKESNQTFMERIWSRKFYCFFNSMLYCEFLGEIAWMVKSIMEKKFVEATYCAPCAALCLLGSAKTYYRIKYGHHINDLITSLRKLQSTDFNSSIQRSLTASEEMRNMVRKLQLAINIVTIVNVTGLVAFMCGPLTNMAFTYWMSGKVELRLPFLVMYPFNEFDLRIYPFIYIRHVIGGEYTNIVITGFIEMKTSLAALCTFCDGEKMINSRQEPDVVNSWLCFIYDMIVFLGTFALFTVFGPDCLYYTFCTYVQVQFRLLYHCLETIITPNERIRLQNGNDKYDEKFRACISRHRELIRCCNLIETVYSKSALFNFMSSTLLLCLAGFNIMAHVDWAMFSNFLSFLFICLLQIYLICDYGDKVSRASMDLSSAIYNSQWYTVDVKTAKDLLVILTRAQKSCKLTAYMFADINLGAFTRILSTSWSYFALLKSVYSRGGDH